MKNKFSIDNLVNDLKPVSPLWSAPKRSTLWFLLQMLLTMAIMYFVYPSLPNLIHDFSQPLFTIQFLLLILGSALSGYFAFSSVIPGGRPQNYKMLCLVLLLALISLLLPLWFGSYIEHPHRPHCDIEVMVYSVAGFFATLVFLKKGFLQSLTLRLSILAVSFLSMALMHLNCSVEPMHAFVCHLLPILPILIAEKIFSVWKR